VLDTIINERKLNTTRASMICFKRSSLGDYLFRLSSLGHHQVVNLYRGNYTIYGMVQYVKLFLLFDEISFLSIKVFIDKNEVSFTLI